MNSYEVEDKEKARKDNAKKAVGLAMVSRWEEAVQLNGSILEDFPRDLEAYNRLGKALSELGRNREAKGAFRKALEVSPHNSIARKNLERLERLGDETSRPVVRGKAKPHVFIEESGKAGVTSLVTLGQPQLLLKLAPGYPVQLEADGTGLRVNENGGEYVGQVEPRLASRLAKLMKGGNRYEAAITSVGEGELTIIIREVYKDPSQLGIMSFPSRGAADNRVYLPGTVLGYEAGDEDPTAETEKVVVKDWSDDDTEPGDDTAYTPVFHRVINTDREAGQEDEF